MRTCQMVDTRRHGAAAICLSRKNIARLLLSNRKSDIFGLKYWNFTLSTQTFVFINFVSKFHKTLTQCLPQSTCHQSNPTLRPLALGLWEELFAFTTAASDVDLEGTAIHVFAAESNLKSIGTGCEWLPASVIAASSNRGDGALNRFLARSGDS